jgi:cellulose synthase/poly-beta-1,6-N-acetylglucosamine synthase-like glycosyltransferase
VPDILPTIILASLVITIVFLCTSIYLLIKVRNRTKYIKKRNEELENNSIEKMVNALNEQTTELEEKVEKGSQTHHQLIKLLIKSRKTSSHINVGLSPPTFSFEDSETLKSTVQECREEQHSCIVSGDATDAYSNWEWFGSKKDGARMVADYQILLLKAFNAEFEAIRKQMRVKTPDTARAKLERLAENLERLGETANVSVSFEYLDLKMDEMQAWHDELVRKEKLKQERKLQQARLREQNSKYGDDSDELDEEISAQEMELQKAQRKAEKLAGNERAKLELLIEKIKTEKARLEEKFNRAISQAQVTRAGFIYVISNHGCFGENVVKIGMTRRLEPMDRVNELGDASVPFKFDVHTLAFVEDAPKVEKALHKAFTKQRVNIDNHRKEFFRVPLEVVKESMEGMGVNSDWYFEIEAKEYTESELIRTAMERQAKKRFTSASLPESI